MFIWIFYCFSSFNINVSDYITQKTPCLLQSAFLPQTATEPCGGIQTKIMSFRLIPAALRQKWHPPKPTLKIYNKTPDNRMAVRHKICHSHRSLSRCIHSSLYSSGVPRRLRSGYDKELADFWKSSKETDFSETFTEPFTASITLRSRMRSKMRWASSLFASMF